MSEVTVQQTNNQAVVQMPGIQGPGVPAGGTPGQLLQKNSNADFDTQWGANIASLVPYTGATSDVDISPNAYRGSDFKITVPNLTTANFAAAVSVGTSGGYQLAQGNVTYKAYGYKTFAGTKIFSATPLTIVCTIAQNFSKVVFTLLKPAGIDGIRIYRDWSTQHNIYQYDFPNNGNFTDVNNYSGSSFYWQYNGNVTSPTTLSPCSFIATLAGKANLNGDSSQYFYASYFYGGYFSGDGSGLYNVYASSPFNQDLNSWNGVSFDNVSASYFYGGYFYGDGSGLYNVSSGYSYYDQDLYPWSGVSFNSVSAYGFYPYGYSPASDGGYWNPTYIEIHGGIITSIY